MRLLGIVCVLLVACVQPMSNASEGDDNNCDSVVTQDLLQCASIRHSKADSQLNSVYRDKTSSIRSRREALRDVQRTWITFRDDYCNSIREESRGGNEGDIEKTFCLAILTENRIAELNRIGHDNDDVAFFRVLRSLERVGYDRSELLQKLSSGPEDSTWQRYARKNCEFLGKTSGDAMTGCLARMNLDRGY